MVLNKTDTANGNFAESTRAVIRFPHLIFFLNSSRDSMVFISGVNYSQILCPKYDADSDPLETMWIGCAINCGVSLR